jgi:hypothetical protein
MLCILTLVWLVARQNKTVGWALILIEKHFRIDVYENVARRLDVLLHVSRCYVFTSNSENKKCAGMLQDFMPYAENINIKLIQRLITTTAMLIFTTINISKRQVTDPTTCTVHIVIVLLRHK